MKTVIITICLMVVAPKISFASIGAILEAKMLALEASGELQPPEGLTNQILNDLAAIRTAYPEVVDVTYRMPFAPDEIMVGITEEAAAQFQAGEYHELDELNQLYGVIESHLHSGLTTFYLLLKFDKVYNAELLSDIYEQAHPEGLVHAQPNYIYGDVSTIYADLPDYIFRQAWGDCEAGCAKQKFWHFKVENSQVSILPTIHYVNAETGKKTNHGLTENAPLATIQRAVDRASDGETVVIAPGTYTGPGNRDILVDKNITIRSQNGPETCIIDCNGSINDFHTGFLMQKGTLAGITITRGFTIVPHGVGGAVTCLIGSIKINNCVFTNNNGMRGGAVFCENSNVEIMNSFFTGNSACIVNCGNGGAIYCNRGSVFIANSTVSGNSALAGGGIYCAQESSMTIKNCVISENSVVLSGHSNGFGGGIHCERDFLTIIDSQICRNSAYNGAGISCVDAYSIFISDSNIYSNDANGPINGLSGGGIYFKTIAPSPPPLARPFTILNSSITDNVVRSSDCKGAGLYIETPVTPGSNPYKISFILSGCIVARNSAQTPLSGGLSYGGGLYCKGQIQLLETEIKENEAYRGGGIYNAGPVINMSRCKINSNYAFGYGNAIFSITGETVLENSVVSGNQGGEGHAIKFEQGATLKMANCTVVGNITPAISASSANPSSSITNSIIYDNCKFHNVCRNQIVPSSLLISYSDVQGSYLGVNNIDADPCFLQAGYWDTNDTQNTFDDFWVEGDYRLTAVSPCIDSGGVAFLVDNKDLAGKPRITGVVIDMGAYEYQNTAPIANAGEDVNVFAWINGNAELTLDGSGSYDADGDELTYLWTWSIEGNTYDTSGVNPTIELPVGQHTIELVVNDGWEDSEPNEVMITVVEPIEGTLQVTPRIINGRGEQQRIMTMLRLPEGIRREQIDTNCTMLLYPGEIEANWQHISQYSRRGVVIFACFNGSALIDAVGSPGPVQLDVVGRLKTGQYFFGRDTVQIIDQHSNHRP